MKLSTSTNLLFLRPDKRIYPPKQAVEKIVKAGFDTLDFNFYDWVITKGSPYMEEDGDAWLAGMAVQARQLGVRYCQAHAHFYNFASDTLGDQERAWQQKQVVRSIRGAGVLGAEVVVTHPCTCFAQEGNYRTISKERNRRYFLELLEETRDVNIRIALENMADVDTAPKRKYCADPEELADLVDSIHDERLGICWDFEHGDLMGQNQPEIVRYLGKRLIATHVSEQHGYAPVYLTHRLPMTGMIRWEPIMKALRDIEYNGCFSYEAHNYLNALPDCAIDSALKLAWDIGRYLMDLYTNIEEGCQ